MRAVSTRQHHTRSSGRAQGMLSFSLRTSSFLKCHEMCDLKRDLHTLSLCCSVFICPRHPLTHLTLNVRLFVTLTSPGCRAMVGSAAVEDLAFGCRGAGFRAQSLAGMSILSHVLHVRYLPWPGKLGESMEKVGALHLFTLLSLWGDTRKTWRERKRMSEERMG